MGSWEEEREKHTDTKGLRRQIQERKGHATGYSGTEIGGKHRKGNMKVTNEVMEIRREGEGKMEMSTDEVSGGEERGVSCRGQGSTALHFQTKQKRRGRKVEK